MTGKNLLKKYNNYKKLINLFLIILIILIPLIIFYHSNVNYLSTSDEKILFASAKSYVINNSLIVNRPLNQYYNTCIFSGYETSYKNGTEYLSTSSGSPIFYSIFYLIAGDNMMVLVAIISLIASSLLIYFICYRLTKLRCISCLCALILILSPIYIKFSSGFFNIMPSLCFFLIILFFLFTSTNKYKYLFIGISLIPLILIRPQDIIIIFPILAVLFYTKENSLKNIIYLILPLSLALISILVGNYFFFKDFLYFPQQHTADLSCLIIGNGQNNSFINSVVNYFSYSENMVDALLINASFFFSSTYAFPLLIVGIFSLILLWVLLSKNDYKNPKKFQIFFVVLIVFIILMYGRRINNYYGFGQKNLQSSFLRYILYALAILPITFSILLKKLYGNLNKKILIFIIFLSISLLFCLIIYTYNYPINGINQYNQNRINLQTYENLSSNWIGSNDILLTDYYTDKIFFPQVINVIAYDKSSYSALTDENLTKQELLRVIKDIQSSNNSIYLAKQESYYDNWSLFNEINSVYILNKIDSHFGIDFYKIVGEKTNIPNLTFNYITSNEST